MPYLLDTNVLLRLVERTHPLHTTVRTAIRSLRMSGEELFFTLQNLAEFWCVSTRPAVARGGLGLTPVQADREARRLERLFSLLPEDPAVYAEWRSILVTSGVSGVHVHDARL